ALDWTVRLGMLGRVLELRPGAVAVLQGHDMLRVAQLEALLGAFAERIGRAPAGFGLASTEAAQQLLGVLAVMLELHDVLLRLRPASASSGGERVRQLDVTRCCRRRGGSFPSRGPVAPSRARRILPGCSAHVIGGRSRPPVTILRPDVSYGGATTP